MKKNKRFTILVHDMDNGANSDNTIQTQIASEHVEHVVRSGE